MEPCLAPNPGDLPGTVTNSLPIPLIVVDRSMRVVCANEAASAGVELSADPEPDLRCGDVLRCVRALRARAACGCQPECGECKVRGAVLAVTGTGCAARQVAKIMRRGEEGPQHTHVLVTAWRLPVEGSDLAALMLDDVTELVAELAPYPD